VVVLMLALPAVAGAGSQDIASTRAFVAAATRVERAEMARRPQEVAAVDALIKHVETACPRSLPRTLQTGTGAQMKTWTALASEAFYGLGLTYLGPFRPAVWAAVRAIAHLRWTSAALNRRVARYVRDGRIELGLRLPDLCQQVRTARRSDFTIVPVETRTFLRRLLSASPGSDTTVASLAQQMKPLANPQELADIAQLGRLETRVDRVASRFVLKALDRLSRALTG
jgi:hypothetical protein